VESVSVSQLNSFNRCPRRWFFQKVRRVKVPTEHKTGANTGTEIHAEHDHYYKRGFVVKGSKHEKKVRASLEALPPCGPGVISELPFRMPVDVPPCDGNVPPAANTLTFTGVIDLVDKRNLPALLKITDHKSTGSIAKLEETPVDVANDPQMLTYAHVGYTLFDPERVEVAHNTISSKHVARTIPPVYVHVTRQKAQQNWVDQARTISTMIKLAASPPADWNDVACNTEACSDFNGCDFLPICTLKTPTLGVPPMAHDESAASDLLARLNALNGGASVSGWEQGEKKPIEALEALTTPAVVIEAPADLVETGEIALLPPDAPSRMTPAVEEAPKAVKKGRPKKVTGEATPPPVNVPVKWQYKVDKMINTVDELVAALEAYGEDGWEFVGFFDGVYAVFKRPVL